MSDDRIRAAQAYLTRHSTSSLAITKSSDQQVLINIHGHPKEMLNVFRGAMRSSVDFANLVKAAAESEKEVSHG